MGALFGASYLTTIFGILAAVAGGLAALPDGTLPVGWAGWMQFFMALFAGGGLVAAKSYNVSNATKPGPAGMVVSPTDSTLPPSVPTRTMSLP